MTSAVWWHCGRWGRKQFFHEGVRKREGEISFEYAAPIENNPPPQLVSPPCWVAFPGGGGARLSFVCASERQIEESYLVNPLSTSLSFLPRLHLIILISPQHVSKGTGLSWNLAHSAGWGNRLRPDWQPPDLIQFPHSRSCLLLLL